MNIKEKYEVVMAKLLDGAANAQNAQEAREWVEAIKVLGEGVTYNAVLRCLDDKR